MPQTTKARRRTRKPVAKPKALFIVHVEEMFSSHFPTGYLERIQQAIRKGTYEKIFYFLSHIGGYEPIEALAGLVDQVVDWGWGYEPEEFEGSETEKCWVIPSDGHDWTWVPPLLRCPRGWDNYDVHICGCFDRECLADMETVLEHVKIPYTRVEDLIL